MYTDVDVEFPERPGALGKFLDLLNPEFNISLFHYRNHGGGETRLPLLHLFLLVADATRIDIGKVLVGIQVPPGKKPDLDRFLAKLQFPFVDETDSDVYKSFLK